MKQEKEQTTPMSDKNHLCTTNTSFIKGVWCLERDFTTVLVFKKQ